MTVAILAALWAAPILAAWMSGATFLTELAVFFSKLAVVTFGGAYAVLAYMTQAIVETHGWLSTAQMIDALGLAETTPGPLILVTQFVGLLAGFAQGGTGLALLAGAMTLWVTFVPCFLWIFAGAPSCRVASVTRPRLKGALGGDFGGGRRGDPEPVGLVRAACHLRKRSLSALGPAPRPPASRPRRRAVLLAAILLLGFGCPCCRASASWRQAWPDVGLTRFRDRTARGLLFWSNPLC